MDGLYCELGICAAAGPGMDGDACITVADCASGFHCVLMGLSGGVCVPGGEGDLGHDCSETTDCFSPLACVDGMCGVPEGGFPFGVPWPGVDCPEETGPVEAYFRVPRGTEEDGDFFRLPIPNDVRLNGTTIDLGGFPTPGEGVIGFDIVQRYVDAVEAERDGWGSYQGVFFRFSGRLDTDSFDDDIFFVDLQSGNTMGLFWSYTTGRNKYMCNNRIIVKRPTGAALEPGAYVAYMTDGITDEDGNAVVRPDDLGALLGSSMPSDSALAPHWSKYAPFRQYLSDNMIDPATVLNASLFTVGTPRSLVEQMQPIVDATPPSDGGWTLCDGAAASPCPDVDGPRACGAVDPDYHELHTMVSLPVFQQGTAPYLDEADGGDIMQSGGAPQVVRNEQVCLTLTIPKATMPAGGWPTVVFAHGTGGHYRSHLENGSAATLAQGVEDGQGNTVRAATIGIDQVQHATRRGGSDMSPQDLYFNFSNPAAAVGNPQQGAADQMALLAWSRTVSEDAMGPTGEVFDLSPTAIAFWGHSQGASAGALAVPYGNWAGAVFTGQGASLKDALVTKTSPVNIAGVLPWVLQDFSSEGTLPHGANHAVVNLLQHFIDPGDPVTYGRLLTITPPAMLEAKHAFMVYGHADTFTPDTVQTTYALSAALDVAASDASVSTPIDIGGKMEVPLPAMGNHDINMKTISVFTRQYAPSGSDDGHFVAFDVQNANDDLMRFLAGILSGVVPQVGQ